MLPTPDFYDPSQVTDLYIERAALVADAAVAEPDRFAAVAVVDPRNPDAADRLEHWVGARGCRGLRLRPRIPEEDACFCASSTTALWERCRDSNVVVSVLAGPEHLGRLASWLEGFPEVDVVIDHFAHPLVAGGAASLQPLLALARFPRVFVKVSGYCHFSNAPWPYEECGALNRAVYDHFGLGRLIWGSDFPHSLLKCGYAGTLKVLDRSWDWLTPDERARMLGGTATGLYWPSA